MQDYTSSNKIKENKYKILRMSLLLGSDENREETLNNFEDAARDIDIMNDEIYLHDLEGKFYDTLKLEEEEKKLEVLVDLIGGRVEQRISLLTDFANVTGFDLQNLPAIKYYDKLDDYKERLKYIREYLSNTNKLESLNKEVKEASNQLEKAYKNKASSEEFNQRSEDIVYNKFLQIVKSLDYFQNINEDNVDECLDKAVASAIESKKSLDIFKNSYNTLSRSGISMEEEHEYHSYVVNAQDVYYANKEEEYLIRLYQYFAHKETEYNSILVKRDCINDLIYERLNLRKELGIEGNDVLNSLYDILERQYEDIERQKENIENIEKLNELIQNKKEEINGLELDNQKVEILALLREFCIIDTYSDVSVANNHFDEKKDLEHQDFDEKKTSENQNFDNQKVVFEENDLHSSMDVTVDLPPKPVDDNLSESISNNTSIFEIPENASKVKEEEAAVNEVISVEDANHIDLDLVHSKANKVMQRVGEMLGVKLTDDDKEEVAEVQMDVSVSEPVAPSVEDSVSEPVAPSVEDSVSEPKKVVDFEENPLFQEPTLSSKEDVVDPELSLDSNFWFPSDATEALNELPDLDVNQNADGSDNIFNSNKMPDLNFPDLKVDFNHNNDTEA